jgi:hypothetical protein
MRAETLRRWPGGLLLKPARVVELAVAPTALLVGAEGGLVEPLKLTRSKALTAKVTADVSPVTLRAALGAPRTLTVRALLVQP